VKVKRLIALVSIALCTSVTAAYASMTVPFGLYIGTNQGISRAYNKSYPGSSIKHTGYGFSLEAGYRINLYIAGEIGYSHFAPTTINNSVGNQAASDSHYAFDLAGKLILPIGNTGAEVYGKVGVARVKSNLGVNAANAAVNNLSYTPGSSCATGVYAAGGAEYAITPHFSANLQWARSQGNRYTGNMNLSSLGLSYIF
jgi:opacity protein-like surface antigen